MFLLNNDHKFVNGDRVLKICEGVLTSENSGFYAEYQDGKWLVLLSPFGGPTRVAFHKPFVGTKYSKIYWYTRRKPFWERFKGLFIFNNWEYTLVFNKDY